MDSLRHSLAQSPLTAIEYTEFAAIDTAERGAHDTAFQRAYWPPSTQPSANPTSQPSVPTGQPSAEPSSQPSSQPTAFPSFEPDPHRNFNSTGQRYEALDEATFAVYEAAWKENHENWINLETADIGCKADEPRYFPVCVGGYMLQPRGGQHNTTCSKVMCIPADSGKYPESNSACFPTPSDTMDYAPPARPDAPDNDSVICPVPLEYEESFVSDEYAFSTGIPGVHPHSGGELNLPGRRTGAPGVWAHHRGGGDRRIAGPYGSEQVHSHHHARGGARHYHSDGLRATPRLPTSMTTGQQDPHTQAPSSCAIFRTGSLSDSDGKYRFET